MNFQGLVKIEKADFYLELASRRAKERASIIRQPAKGSRLEKSKKIEIERVNTFNNVLKERIEEILVKYPSIDNLPEFYVKLVKITLEYPVLKKSLGGLNWALKKLDMFHQN